MCVEPFNGQLRNMVSRDFLLNCRWWYLFHFSHPRWIQGRAVNPKINCSILTDQHKRNVGHRVRGLYGSRGQKLFPFFWPQSKRDLFFIGLVREAFATTFVTLCYGDDFLHRAGSWSDQQTSDSLAPKSKWLLLSVIGRPRRMQIKYGY